MHQGQIKNIKARKPHICSWCGESVAKGEVYESTFIVCENEPWTRKMHKECSVAEETYDYGGEILYYEGQFMRGHNHQHNHDTMEIYAKYGCPKCKETLAAAKGVKE